MRVIAGVALAASVLAGCAGGDNGTASERGPSPSTKSASPPPPSDAAAPSAGLGGKASPSKPAQLGRRIKVARSEYGRMLFDHSGQAIYLFAEERTASPRCYGACSKAWPPVLTPGPPRGVGGARSQLLGTTRRNDGSLQVTYAGHPLYFYAHEGKNEVLCHNVAEFGGLWLVVTPTGEPAA